MVSLATLPLVETMVEGLVELVYAPKVVYFSSHAITSVATLAIASMLHTSSTLQQFLPSPLHVHLVLVLLPPCPRWPPWWLEPNPEPSHIRFRNGYEEQRFFRHSSNYMLFCFGPSAPLPLVAAMVVVTIS